MVATKKSVKREFWARAIFYEPFVMGGDVYQHVRYKHEGEEVKIYGNKGNVAKVNDHWEVFEAVSGGLCGKGKTKEAAIADAIHNVRITPSFKDQIKELGKIENCREVTADEALQRLSKSK